MFFCALFGVFVRRLFASVFFSRSSSRSHHIHAEVVEKREGERRAHTAIGPLPPLKGGVPI